MRIDRVPFELGGRATAPVRSEEMKLELILFQYAIVIILSACYCRQGLDWPNAARSQVDTSFRSGQCYPWPEYRVVREPNRFSEGPVTQLERAAYG